MSERLAYEILPPADAETRLTPTQSEVLWCISQGQTMNQTGRLNDLSREEVLGAHAELKQLYGTESLPRIVNDAIQTGDLAVTVLEDEAVEARLTAADRKLIGFYAKGGTDSQVARSVGVDVKAVVTYHQGLLQKLNAWSNAHAVRRAYEYGILSINASQGR